MCLLTSPCRSHPCPCSHTGSASWALTPSPLAPAIQGGEGGQPARDPSQCPRGGTVSWGHFLHLIKGGPSPPPSQMGSHLGPALSFLHKTLLPQTHGHWKSSAPHGPCVTAGDPAGGVRFLTFLMGGGPESGHRVGPGSGRWCPGACPELSSAWPLQDRGMDPGTAPPPAQAPLSCPPLCPCHVGRQAPACLGHWRLWALGSGLTQVHACAR